MAEAPAALADDEADFDLDAMLGEGGGDLLGFREGTEAFDVFSGQRIAVSTRKLLASKGVEITVDGDDLVIADKRVPVTDRAAVKELVQTMHEVLRDRDTREAKKDAKIETLTNQVDQGVRELSQLQRELDAMSERDPS